MFKKLLNKITDKKIKIGVIGLGYVGLPLAIRFCDEGFETVGFDIDKEKIKKLKLGKAYINHIPSKNIKNILAKKFMPTSNFDEVSNIDIIIICVPTPLGLKGEPDLSFIKNTLKTIKPYLKANQLLVLESTTYPGTTEEVIAPIITKAGFKPGKDYYIGYSPEREDPGNKTYNLKTIPKIVSGLTSSCLKITQQLYSSIVDQVVPVSSTKTAEMTKILENIHRSVNIGLINELKIVANKMDIDIYEVIKAASTKPFGFTPYYPGPGLGGHCLPIDPFYLTWKAQKIGVKTKLIELAGKVNSKMPNYVIERSREALNGNGKSIKNSNILVLGLSYKKNIDDSRESPSFVIIDMLMKLGAKVEYSDPLFKKAPKTRKYMFKLESVVLSKKNIKSFDLIILATDHDIFNYDFILKEANLIIDTRGKFDISQKVFQA